MKDTSSWHHGCDRTSATADQGYELKSSILSDVTFNKFFLTIAEAYIRRYLGTLGLFAV